MPKFLSAVCIYTICVPNYPDKSIRLFKTTEKLFEKLKNN